MPHYKTFIKSLTENKYAIFHKKEIPDNKMGVIHAPALQLLARGIIELKISDVTKKGTEKLNDNHIVVDLANALDSDGITMPAYCLKNVGRVLTSSKNK